MNLPHQISRNLSIIGLGVSFLIAGAQIAAAQTPGAPPPPNVEVTTVNAREVPLSYTYAGRVSAFREVEVRAQVGGILKQRAYVEGARVKAGDVLFQIDPTTYEADVARAAAQVQTAQAQLSQANRDKTRAVELFDRQVGTQKARDDALSAVELAEASVAAADAQLKTAQINLDYATVRAPIDGVTSLDVLPEGSLISTGSLLTKITQLDPVYVTFSFTDANAAEIRRIVESHDLTDVKLSASLTFGDETAYDKSGAIDFTSSSIDTQTGTILSRAVFANPDMRLIPGQFVRVTVTGMTIPSAIVVPEIAVLQGPQGKFVYTIDDKDVAAIAPIELGQSVEGGWVVTSGLKSGDRIITSGVIKVRPGSPVAASKTIVQTAQAE
ncbi:efflux RND transporter periplasmic adaptor subunit [Kaistia dalseonensis]|uniref:Membrane fusion protein (Multidrug efflux system) n=1 Tax=Kaistia dalseonensis TaxID=410840 RepID=A0ABU0H8L7_9HYPH|nr:efflux RND transporter periplasmic adaptor subunit [Kaistia dalseonensis]MCX5496049.1 efflux RND transporter periplasmic adaptor subunit [Kaistia dalseonensis]MDQ0438653.1 membrane fusion protein (multidrug efflux system) [Kaistia dalseonensis]